MIRKPDADSGSSAHQICACPPSTGQQEKEKRKTASAAIAANRHYRSRPESPAPYSQRRRRGRKRQWSMPQTAAPKTLQPRTAALTAGGQCKAMENRRHAIAPSGKRSDVPPQDTPAAAPEAKGHTACSGACAAPNRSVGKMHSYRIPRSIFRCPIMQTNSTHF